MTTSPPSSAATTPLLPKSGWTPTVADVIHYRYLWRAEHARHEEDGTKIRPCVVIAVDVRPRATRIVVAPISTQNLSPDHSFRVPEDIAKRLQLDPKSQIVANEANAFDWIGPDVFHRGRPPKQRHTYFGAMPERLVLNVLANLIKLRISPIPRT